MTDHRVAEARRSSRTDLVLFAALTFGASWVLMLAAGLAGSTVDDGPAAVLFSLGTSGPTLVALGLWIVGRRRARVPDAARRQLTGAGRWLPFAVLAGVVPALLACLVQDGGVDWSTPERVIADKGGVLVVLVGLLVAGPLAEEFGWRGYAQPRLRERFSPTITVLVLGTGWALWHLPLFLLPGTTQHAMGLGSASALLFLLTFLPWSYLIWFAAERLHGGVPAAITLHLAVNAAHALLPVQTVLARVVILAVMTLLALGCAALARTAPVRRTV